MRLYLESLKRLHAARPAWSRIYPGHGPPIADGRRAVDEYIGHRQQREAQICEQLRGKPPAAAQSAGQLVGVLYRDRVLSPELRQAATETVHNHLVWLSAKGKVDCMDPLFSIGARWRWRG